MRRYAMGQPSLVELDRELSRRAGHVVLAGESLSLSEVLAVSRDGARVEFTGEPAIRVRVAACHERMLANIRDGVPIYGCTTAYGARAATRANGDPPDRRLEAARATSRAIAHVDVSVGPAFPAEIVRGA